MSASPESATSALRAWPMSVGTDTVSQLDALVRSASGRIPMLTPPSPSTPLAAASITPPSPPHTMTCPRLAMTAPTSYACLLYTSDAADDLLCVDLGGRR